MKQGILRKLISVALLMLFAAFFSVTTDSFLTWRNINSILREVSVVGLLSLGVSFVIIGGGIDLSTGSVLGLSAMIASRLVTDTLIPIWIIVLIVLTAGTVLGLVRKAGLVRAYRIIRDHVRLPWLCVLAGVL